MALEGRTLLSTVTVSNTNDSGDGSLRQAILDANTNAGDDAIVFSSLFNSRQTITLTGGQLTLTDTATTTITGPGANLLTVSGNGAGRVFQVTDGAAAALSGLTITGGSSDTGGGVRNDGTAKGHLRVTANGVDTDYLVPPYGQSVTHDVAIAEDSWTEVTVTDLDTGEVLWTKKWFTDCVLAPTQQVTAPPTTVQTQVLGTQVTAPAAQEVLAFTGSDSEVKAGIGASLLAVGAALLTFGRRRKGAEA